jgi:histidinol-phosphate aminotransferase
VVAQRAAVESLHAESALADRVAALVAERDRVCQALAGQGWRLPATEANFVWLRLGADSARFAATCERAGIMVRPYGTDGVRVTIGEPAANDAFLTVAGQWRGSQTNGPGN